MSDHPQFPVRVIAPVAVAIALLSWWWLTSDSVAPPVNEVVHAEAHGPAPSLPPKLEKIERETRSEPVVAPVDLGVEPPDADLDHPYTFALGVHLRGPLGLPIDDARVFLSPENAGFSEWPVASEVGNVFASWRGRTRTMRIQVAVVAWGVLQPIRSIVVEADVTAKLAFNVVGRNDVLTALRQAVDRGEKPSKELMKQARDISGRQKFRRRRMDYLDIQCGRKMFEYKFHRCTECHDASFIAPYQAVARSGTMTVGLHAHSYFEDLRRSRMHGEAGDKRMAEIEKARKQKKLAAKKKSATYRASLSGRVRLADGATKGGMTVAWIGKAGGVLATTMTDARGRYSLKPMAGGTQRVIVVAGPLGGADRSVLLAPTDNTVANFTLSSNQSVIGKVLDEGGDPLKDWRVELVRDVAGWSGMTSTDAKGTFAAYGVPGPVQCLVWPRGNDKPFPVIYGVEALVDASSITLRLHADQPIRGRLRVSADLPKGHERARVDARVIQLDTGRVAQMEAFGFANEFHLEPLAAGRYRIELGSPGLAWAAQDVHVDGRGLWPIGGMHLAAPGRVRIVQLPGAPDLRQYPHAFYRRTKSVDVRVDYDWVDGAMSLAPGKHVLVWRATGGLRAREFEVVSGAEVEIPIWPE